MKLNELPDWPPPWQPLLLRSEKYITGEIGLLKSIKRLYTSDGCLVLTMEHEGVEHRGVLHIDPVLRDKVMAMMEEQRGLPIEAVGQLEL